MFVFFSPKKMEYPATLKINFPESDHMVVALNILLPLSVTGAVIYCSLGRMF